MKSEPESKVTRLKGCSRFGWLPTNVKPLISSYNTTFLFSLCRKAIFSFFYFLLIKISFLAICGIFLRWASYSGFSFTFRSCDFLVFLSIIDLISNVRLSEVLTLQSLMPSLTTSMVFFGLWLSIFLWCFFSTDLFFRFPSLIP